MQSRYLSLILAGATAIAPAVEAETVIYGRLRSNLAHSGPDYGEDSGPRFGLKSSEELTNELKELFQLEWQIDTANGVNTSNERQKNHPGYVDGDWGATTIGRQWSLYQNGVDTADIWDLSLAYRKGPLSIGTSYMNYRGNGLDNRELWGAATRYRFSDFALTAQYEYTREQAFENDYEWTFMGEYYVGNNILRAMYSDRNWDGSTDPHWTLGLNHHFSKRTSIYAEFQDNDTAAEQLYGAGIRLDF